MSARLAKVGLPGVAADLPVTTPKLRIVWNPQGFGAPNVPGNSAQAYYPGDAYVDVVGDDLYDIPGTVRHGRQPRGCTAHIRPSRTRSPSSGSGASTIHGSFARWGNG